MKSIGNHIGRFELIRELGRGAQSVVYLGFDPQLQRQVAIKSQKVAEQKDRERKVAAFITEARTVSQLQHPNIVPIFEAGEHEGQPYLVFEYVDGGTLAERIRQEGCLPPARAVELLRQVLDALAHAHAHDIVHRDLKPSNILMSRDGLARVTDFGVASSVTDAAGKESGLVGTAAYLSPEYVHSRSYTPQSDVFAAGLILGEALLGHPLVRERNLKEIAERLTSGVIYRPDEFSGRIDERLGGILQKSLARHTQDRYATAREMRDVLAAYLQPALGAVSEEARQSTLDFLLRRMRHKSDFPALSESVSAINKLAGSETESVTKLSNSILKDFALTSKLLKMVNTAYYNRFGGGAISTISRAVVILGFNAVRNIAVTLMLFEHLQNKGHAAQLIDEFIRTLFCGILARAVSANNGVRDVEEAFICAMFHNLGRLLSMFYFAEEAAEVEKLMGVRNIDEAAASTQVLGISYQDLGVGIARSWGFPDQIVHSMKHLTAARITRTVNETEKLRVISSFSNEVCQSVMTTAPEDRRIALRKILERFREGVGMSDVALQTVLEEAMRESVEYAGVLHLNLQQSHFGRKLHAWVEEIFPSTEAAVVEDDPLADTILGDTAGLPEPRKPQKPDAQEILTAGIQDITNSLVEGVALNDLLRIILETMYRGIGFQRTLLCIKDSRSNTMVGRFGFGADISRIARNFNFTLNYSPDVFHAATSKNVDILIANIEDAHIKGRIPEWYRKSVGAETFLLFPINIKAAPVALIYADCAKAGDIVIPEKELNLLRTLRNQAVLAIKQSF